MFLKSSYDKAVKHYFRAMPVDQELGPITRIDAAEVSPVSVGMTQKSIDKIWGHAQDVYRSGMHPMISVCLRRHGEIVLHRSLGYSHYVGTPEALVAELDTPVCLFSASKVVAAVLLHKLAEDGLLDMLNPVSYYLPEFAAAGKSNITVYQLLSHRAGVPGIPEDIPLDILYDHDEALKYICQQEALDSDGRVVAYHALTAGFIMTELVKRITGLSMNEYLDQVIRQPMGMTHFRFGMPHENISLAAQHYLTGAPNTGPLGRKLAKVLGAEVDEAVALSNTEAFLTASIPSGNLYATAEEACRFFQMLLQQGQWQGRPILSPLTIGRLTREAGTPQFDRSLVLPMRYSAGTMLGGRHIGLYGRHTPYAFGHVGFCNIFCWADPERDIAVSIMNNGKPVLGPHIVPLLKMVDAISQGCDRCVDVEQLQRKMIGQFANRAIG